MRKLIFILLLIIATISLNAKTIIYEGTKEWEGWQNNKLTFKDCGVKTLILVDEKKKEIHINEGGIQVDFIFDGEMYIDDTKAKERYYPYTGCNCWGVRMYLMKGTELEEYIGHFLAGYDKEGGYLYFLNCKGVKKRTDVLAWKIERREEMEEPQILIGRF